MTQPFEGKWDAAGVLRLSAALKGAALTMPAEAEAPAAAMVARPREISGSGRSLSCL